MSEAREQNPEQIYLEPAPGSPEGRMWCEDDVWIDGDEPGGVEYVRADLHDAEIDRLRRIIVADGLDPDAPIPPGLAVENEQLRRELEEAREREQALVAYISAEIDHTEHLVTCLTCLTGHDHCCDEQHDLWRRVSDARDKAWEAVRPGVTALRGYAETAALANPRYGSSSAGGSGGYLIEATKRLEGTDPAERDRKGATMHALVTGAPDLWNDLSADERAGWIEDAERYEEMLRGGVASLDDPNRTPDEE